MFCAAALAACFASSDADNASALPSTPGGDASAPAYFATEIVSFTPGACAGFGADRTPSPALGPPEGGGGNQGSFDVLSLGQGGTIVLAFGGNAIVDGPGPDFTVFENPFYIGGNEASVAAEPGEVSVSDDGTHWSTFACTATTAPWGTCAGWHPVFAAHDNAINPRDPAVSGGDAYDLAAVGLKHARYVRIVDKSSDTCAAGAKVKSFGFDLDAVAIVNAER